MPSLIGTMVSIPIAPPCPSLLSPRHCTSLSPLLIIPKARRLPVPFTDDGTAIRRHSEAERPPFAVTAELACARGSSSRPGPTPTRHGSRKRLNRQALMAPARWDGPHRWAGREAFAGPPSGRRWPAVRPPTEPTQHSQTGPCPEAACQQSPPPPRHPLCLRPSRACSSLQ